jgi:hypothetical protein
MNQNLGRIVFLALFFLTFLDAKDLEYKLSVDKKEPFVKEVVILKMELNQLNKSIVLLYDFDLVKSDAYDFKRVEALESDIDNTAKATYTYLVYPLKDGLIDIEFKLIKKVTTKENLAYSFSGDRDNVKGLVTTDTKIDVKPLSLSVKPIPVDTQLVGNFSISYEIKSKDALSYEPLSMNIVIKGEGYPEHFKEFPLKSGDFKIFRDSPIEEISTTKRTTTSLIKYPLAFSSKKSFTLDAINLKAFNPKTQKSYTLDIEEQKFNIKEIKPKELKDKTDYPKPSDDYIDKAKNSFITVFGYLIVFVAGLISGYLLRFKKSKKIQNVPTTQDKISNAKDAKELLNILISIDSIKYKDIIKECEEVVYRGKKVDLSVLKKQAHEIKYV